MVTSRALRDLRRCTAHSHAARPKRLAVAAGLTLALAWSAFAEWVIVMPPTTHTRSCEPISDTTAPIDRWPRHPFGPFPTAEACEALRTEMVRRTTAPGHRERILAVMKERQEEARRFERQLRRDAANDPIAKAVLRIVRRQRKDPRVACDGADHDWTQARCVDRPAP